MLAAIARLRRRDEFSATVRGGRRATRGALVVHVATPGTSRMNPVRTGVGTPPSRAGFVVSRAVGGAVVRNLVRRRLRHLARTSLDTLPPGTDVVIRALPAAATRSFPDLQTDLRDGLAAAMRPREQDRSAGRRAGDRAEAHGDE